MNIVIIVLSKIKISKPVSRSGRAAISYSKLLRERGLRVEVSGERVVLSPAELVTPDIVEIVKAHKPEIISEIRTGVENMTLDEFAGAALAVKVFSRVLGEDIFLCSDERAKQMVSDTGLVVYLPNELLELHRARPGKDNLFQVHEIKRSFDGWVRK